METLPARFMSHLELLWAEPSEMTMASGAIVEGIDVIGHISNRELPVLVDLLLDSLFLQTAKEGVGDGVIPAIALCGSYS